MKTPVGQGRAEGGKLSARLVFVVALALAGCAPKIVEPALSFVDGAVRAEGWCASDCTAPEDGWASVLVVRAGDDAGGPPLLGDYDESKGTLIFTPRFAPSPGVSLTATFHPRGRDVIRATFGEAASIALSSVGVVGVHPGGGIWPENTLRMYVEFSGPMAMGEAWTHLRMRDADGAVIEKPFVELDPELWDSEGKRLTVLFDPGRVKRGLVDNEASGPPLVEGRSVTLEIDAAWRDASGAALAQGFSRSILAGPALRDAIDVEAWTVTPPRDSAGDLVIDFGRPMDHALVLRMIAVECDGDAVEGGYALSEDGVQLIFTPSKPWRRGSHTLVVDGRLEDVAGNRPGKPFDVDLADPEQGRDAPDFVARGFEVLAP